MRLCVCLPDWVFVYLRVCVCLSDRVQRQEREVMLKLKQVVDKQRDELRAKVQENATISKEVEAVRHKHLFFLSSSSVHQGLLKTGRVLPSGKVGRFHMSWDTNCRNTLVLYKDCSLVSVYVLRHVCHMV